MHIDPARHDRETAEVDGRLILAGSDARDPAVFDGDLLVPEHMAIAREHELFFPWKTSSSRIDGVDSDPHGCAISARTANADAINGSSSLTRFSAFDQEPSDRWVCRKLSATRVPASTSSTRNAWLLAAE